MYPLWMHACMCDCCHGAFGAFRSEISITARLALLKTSAHFAATACVSLLRDPNAITCKHSTANSGSVCAHIVAHVFTGVYFKDISSRDRGKVGKRQRTGTRMN